MLHNNADFLYVLCSDLLKFFFQKVPLSKKTQRMNRNPLFLKTFFPQTQNNTYPQTHMLEKEGWCFLCAYYGGRVFTTFAMVTCATICFDTRAGRFSAILKSAGAVCDTRLLYAKLLSGSYEERTVRNAVVVIMLRYSALLLEKSA